MLQPHRVKESNTHSYETAQSESAQQDKMLLALASGGRKEMPFKENTSIPLCPPPILPPKNSIDGKQLFLLHSSFGRKSAYLDFT